jgi:hypothetical protein
MKLTTQIKCHFSLLFVRRLIRERKNLLPTYIFEKRTSTDLRGKNISNWTSVEFYATVVKLHLT